MCYICYYWWTSWYWYITVKVHILHHGSLFVLYRSMGFNKCVIPCIYYSSILQNNFSSVQLLSRVQFFVTPWTAAHHTSLSITNSWSLLKLMSIESVMPSNDLILCCPLLLLPSIFPASVLCIRWPKYWSFIFSISPSSEFQNWFPLGGLVGSPCSPRNPQESSPTLWFKSIRSLALSFVYSPALTSIHDYWGNHSFD